MSNITKSKKCPLRSDIGNCLAIGGFCSSVNEEICEGLQNAYFRGRMKSIKSFKDNLDKYGVQYTIGTQEEVENAIENLDKLMDEMFFKNISEVNEKNCNIGDNFNENYQSTDETLREICRNFMGIVEETRVDCKYQGQIDSCGEPFCECEAYAKSISCEHQRFDYNPDGKINIVTCGMIEKEINNE